MPVTINLDTVPLDVSDWITFDSNPIPPPSDEDQEVAEAKYGHVLGSLLMLLGATSEKNALLFISPGSPENEFTLNLRVSTFMGGNLNHMWVDVTKMGLH